MMALSHKDALEGCLSPVGHGSGPTAALTEPTIMLFTTNKKELLALQTIIDQQASLLRAIDRSMAVIEFDLQGTVLSANENFAKTMGYRPEDVIGKPHTDRKSTRLNSSHWE